MKMLEVPFAFRYAGTSWARLEETEVVKLLAGEERAEIETRGRISSDGNTTVVQMLPSQAVRDAVPHAD